MKFKPNNRDGNLGARMLIFVFVFGFAYAAFAEAGRQYRVASYGLGYCCYSLSAILLLLGCWLGISYIRKYLFDVHDKD